MRGGDPSTRAQAGVRLAPDRGFELLILTCDETATVDFVDLRLVNAPTEARSLWRITANPARSGQSELQLLIGNRPEGFQEPVPLTRELNPDAEYLIEVGFSVGAFKDSSYKSFSPSGLDESDWFTLGDQLLDEAEFRVAFEERCSR